MHWSGVVNSFDIGVVVVGAAAETGDDVAGVVAGAEVDVGAGGKLLGAAGAAECAVAEGSCESGSCSVVVGVVVAAAADGDGWQIERHYLRLGAKNCY